MDGVLAPHTDDIVIFDVPPGVTRGMDEYRATWDLFFAQQGKGAFGLRDLAGPAAEQIRLLPNTPSSELHYTPVIASGSRTD